MAEQQPPVDVKTDVKVTKATAEATPKVEPTADLKSQSLAFQRKGQKVLIIESVLSSKQGRGEKPVNNGRGVSINIADFVPKKDKFIYFVGVDKSQLVSEQPKDDAGNVIGPEVSRYKETHVKAITEQMFLNIVMKNFQVTAQDTEDGLPVLNPQSAADAFLILKNLTPEIVARKFVPSFASAAQRKQVAAQLYTKLTTLEYGNIVIYPTYILFVPGLAGAVGGTVSEKALSEKLPAHIKAMLS